MNNLQLVLMAHEIICEDSKVLSDGSKFFWQSEGSGLSMNEQMDFKKFYKSAISEDRVLNPNAACSLGEIIDQYFICTKKIRESKCENLKLVDPAQLAFTWIITAALSTYKL